MFNLSEDSAKILVDEMCVDLDHLKQKIEAPEISPYCAQINIIIETLCGFVGNKPAEEVNKYCSSLSNLGSEPDLVIDSVRMAFFRYISGGLRDLFIYQENEAWFPKIVLSKILYPNDIDSLEDEFSIYRGCDRSEFETRSFGQSWTTNRDVAKQFAYEHYDLQDWYDNRRRAVLRSRYKKIDALYSDQTEDGEYEIVVRPDLLTDIEIISSGNDNDEGSV